MADQTSPDTLKVAAKLGLAQKKMIVVVKVIKYVVFPAIWLLWVNWLPLFYNFRINIFC